MMTVTRHSDPLEMSRDAARAAGEDVNHTNSTLLDCSKLQHVVIQLAIEVSVLQHSSCCACTLKCIDIGRQLVVAVAAACRICARHSCSNS
jgi:hypothetical protein